MPELLVVANLLIYIAFCFFVGGIDAKAAKSSWIFDKFLPLSVGVSATDGLAGDFLPAKAYCACRLCPFMPMLSSPIKYR